MAPLAEPRPRISLIVPALNEAQSLGPLLAATPPGLVDEIIVVDNGSTDGTAAVSYTHLDVYKRQVLPSSRKICAS